MCEFQLENVMQIRDDGMDSRRCHRLVCIQLYTPAPYYWTIGLCHAMVIFENSAVCDTLHVPLNISVKLWQKDVLIGPEGSDPYAQG